MFDNKGMTACLTCKYGDSAVDCKRCFACIDNFVKYGINGKYYVINEKKEGCYFDRIVQWYSGKRKKFAHGKGYKRTY